MAKLSIVVPVYFNEQNLIPLYDDIKEKVLSKLNTADDYEIVIVDDGSTDNSWEVMNRLAEQDSKIHCYRLSRNFGEHAANLCGLILLTLGVLGEYIWRTMDASRNRPVYIVEEKSRENSHNSKGQ